jgi:flagellar M-ring protein FliF
MKSILKRIGELFRNAEKKKLILIVTLAAVILAAGIIGAVLLNQVHYTVLYSGLDAGEAGTIKTVLDGKGVASKVEGTTILVPEERADDLRIELASEGYPSTGLNYNIFTGSSALGSTDLERRTMLQYQLQENIRQTLRHMEKVKDCIVIVNFASESSFVVSDNTSEASIAVQLSLKSGEMLTGAEARTIQKLVLKCVPNLKPENVSIVDSKMNYYDVSSDSESIDSVQYSSSQQQLTEQMKDILSEQVLRVLEPAIGSGSVAVSVNLNLNFDKQTVNTVEFSPPIEGEADGLVRSSQELYNAVGTSTGASGDPGTDTNGSGNPAYVAEDPATPAEGADTSYTRTYNYELNQVQTQIEKAQGAIQNLTVAVLVNSNIEGIDEYVDSIKNLVAKSIGIKSDYISVELMPFATNDSGMEDAYAQSQQTAQTTSRNGMITTIATIFLVLAFLVIIARLFVRKPVRKEELEAELSMSGARVVGATASGPMDDVTENGFDMSDLVMKKSSEAERIEELMDRYPETVAQILRTWLAEDN